MGIVCGFYRLDDETIEHLKRRPEISQIHIDENYSSVKGKYHIEDDVVFETDKAWDIAKFLLKECDSTIEKVLNDLDGVKIDISGDDHSLRYIKSEKVKKIQRVLDSISPDQILKVYDQDKMIQNHVYRADWWKEPNWDYILSHIETMKKAFAKAAEHGNGIVINWH